MVSRRNALRTAGAALLAAVAGCTGTPGDTTTDEEPGDPTDDTSDATADGTTDDSTYPRRILTGDEGSASAVPGGAAVAVAAPSLHQLVEDAASADGRVEYVERVDYVVSVDAVAEVGVVREGK